MESDIDITKSPKEVFFEGLIEWKELLGLRFEIIDDGELLWQLATQPAVNSVRFEFQDLIDGLEASLIKISRPNPDLAIATLTEAIQHLTNLRNQYLAEQMKEDEE